MQAANTYNTQTNSKAAQTQITRQTDGQTQRTAKTQAHNTQPETQKEQTQIARQTDRRTRWTTKNNQTNTQTMGRENHNSTCKQKSEKRRHLSWRVIASSGAKPSFRHWAIGGPPLNQGWRDIQTTKHTVGQMKKPEPKQTHVGVVNPTALNTKRHWLTERTWITEITL